MHLHFSVRYHFDPGRTRAGQPTSVITDLAARCCDRIRLRRLVAALYRNAGLHAGPADRVKDLKTTFVSAGIASLGALLALVVWKNSQSRPVGIGLGGSLLGLAVSGMHYCGVAAMQVPGRLRLDGQEVAISILISIGFAIVALMRAADLRSLWRRMEVSGWLALCICGLHFTAMTALTIELGAPPSQAGAVLGSGALAVAVGSVSLAILAVSLAATLMEQHLSQRAVLELKRMRLLSDVFRRNLIIHRDGATGRPIPPEAACSGLAGQLVGRALLDLFAEADRPVVIRREHSRQEDLKREELHVQTTTGTLIPVELSSSTIDYEGRSATVAALHYFSD